MKRTFAAGLLALLALQPAAHAQAPGGVIGPAAGGYDPSCLTRAPAYTGCCHHLGCGCFCFRFLSKLNQEGPLFNYGPYTGYYPFEPYGPWNSALAYTGPYPSGGCCGWNGLCGKCGGAGCGACGGSGLCGHGRLGHGGCGVGGCSGGAWGRYAHDTFRNVTHRLFPLGHKSKGCDTCASAAGMTGTDALASSPPAPTPDSVQQTGYPRRER